MKTKLFLVLITVLFLIISAGCTDQYEKAMESEAGQMTEGYTDITPSEAKTMMNNDNLVIVDVSPVWSAGHLPGAINMPLATIDDEINYLSSGYEYLIYCHSDAASIQGAETFITNGFSPVYRLEGNYQAWVNAGYMVETPMYTDVTAKEAKAMMETDPRLVIVDVSPIYEQGHVPGSISVPLSNIDNQIEMLDKSGHYLIYCHSDAASIQGTETFMNAGFNPVYRLQGNYQAWVDAGYPVEK